MTLWRRGILKKGFLLLAAETTREPTTGSAANGLYDPLETQIGWKNGDISLGGGWFALLYGGEETSGEYKEMMIIGHIHDGDLELIGQMPERVTLTVSEA